MHGLEVGQHRAFGEQLIHCAQLALDRAVVEQHIGITRPGVEILERDIDSRQIAAAVGQVGKDVAAARQLDHFGDVIAALAHRGEIV